MEFDAKGFAQRQINQYGRYAATYLIVCLWLLKRMYLVAKDNTYTIIVKHGFFNRNSNAAQNCWPEFTTQKLSLLLSVLTLNKRIIICYSQLTQIGRESTSSSAGHRSGLGGHHRTYLPSTEYFEEELSRWDLSGRHERERLVTALEKGHSTQYSPQVSLGGTQYLRRAASSL